MTVEANLKLTVRMASLAVHIEEFFESRPLNESLAGEFDREAIRGILTDPEVVAHLKQLGDLGLLPVKRVD